MCGDNMPDNVTCTNKRFYAWCQKILPAVYDDSLSYYEVICRLTSKLNETITIINNEGADLTELEDRVTKLEELFKQFQESGFDDFYMEQLEKWMQDNVWCLMSWGARIVWFGISDDGYFTAYVPDNFSFLAFDVIMDPDSPDYGKLMLSYCPEVYEPCEITCWDGDCPKPDLPIADDEAACNFGYC